LHSSYQLSSLSLHDALPIFIQSDSAFPQMWIIKMMKIHLKGSIKNCLRTIGGARSVAYRSLPGNRHQHNIGLLTGKRQSKNSRLDRKSTRLNSSHVKISYAV